MQGESKVAVKSGSNIESPWTGSRGFGSAVDKFLGSMNLISALAQISSPEFKTITANKRRLARSVINRTMEMAQALDCFALRMGDQILSAKVSLSPAMIARSWDPVISATARAIYELSQEIIEAGTPEAAECGVTPEGNKLLLNSVVAFSAAIGSEVERDLLPPVSLDCEFSRAEEILKSGIDPLQAGLKAQCEALLASHRQAVALSESLPQKFPNS